MSATNGDKLLCIVRREIRVLLVALLDAKEWQVSVADAHTPEPWHQSKEMIAIANRALKQAKKYDRLGAKIRSANSLLDRNDLPNTEKGGK